jgi:DNA-binding GntR family transcriptional regulator
MAAPRLDTERSALPATLVELAERRLRDAILSGALQPGQKVVEEQLCADLGISRAPLREALRLLAQQGLVERFPRRGSRVAEWSSEDILQLFALRHVLECHAIETALPLADVDTSLRPARAALDAMRAATDDLDRDDAHRLFHAAVVGLAGNRQLDIALEPILLKLQLPMAINIRAEARHRSSAHEGIDRHQAILTALATNDQSVVIAALNEHGHLDYLDPRLQRQPDR